MKKNKNYLYFERKLELYFGAIIFSAILMIALITSYHFFDISQKSQHKFASIIANIIELSVKRISFSGKYHSRLFLEQIKKDNPQISYIIITDKSGKILAHSNPELNDKYISKLDSSLKIKTFKHKKFTSRDIIFENQYIKELDIPLDYSLSENKVTTLIIGLSQEKEKQDYFRTMLIILISIITISLLALFFIKKVSNKLASPVQDMAERLRVILSSAPILIYIKKKDGDFSEINHYPTPEKEKLMKAIESKLPNIDVAGDSRTESTSNVIILEQNKKIIKYLVKTFPITKYSGDTTTHYCRFAMDITQEEVLRDQLIQSQKMESIGKMAGGIAHDFNNILTYISGYASIIFNSKELPQHLKSDMENIIKGAQKATSLTKKITTFSRGQVLSIENMDLNQLINEMYSLLSRPLRSNIKLELHLEEKQPLIVDIDSAHIELVVINLVNNAVDSIPNEGSISISTSSVSIESNKTQLLLPTGDYVQLTIADTGLGMPAEVLKKIFDPFFTTKDIGKGTGLGLATSYTTIEQHNGMINVFSKENSGTTFNIFLPRIKGGITSKKAINKQNKSFKQQGAGKIILVVEDDELVRSFVKEILTTNGYNVIEAENGQQAIELQEANNIDLVLSDIMMPVMDGWTAYEKISKNNPELKFIFMSGYTAEILKKEAKDHIKYLFIQKPIDSTKLLQKLKEEL